MRKLLLATAALLSLAAPAYATITVCGPDNGNGCAFQDEQKIFFNEVHDSATVLGTVGGQAGPPTNPLVIITAQQGTFDSFLDAGGGFATIDASHGFKAFNGISITIPGYTWTDMVFEIQMARLGGQKGDTETDTFEVRPRFRLFTLLDQSESISPDASFQFNVFDHNGLLDELNLFADRGSAGFFEIKHLQVSGLAAISAPEPSTWVMLVAGFGLMGFMGWRKTRMASV